jgi:hypothetical protein
MEPRMAFVIRVENDIDTMWISKTEFDKLKEILQNWLNPEDATEASDDEDEDEVVETPSKVKNDLPWDGEEDEDETPVISSPAKNYELKTKKSKADKFDELFDDEN